MANDTELTGKTTAAVAMVATVLGVVLPTALTGSILPLVLGLVGMAACTYALLGKDYGVYAALAGVLLFFVGGFAFWYPWWQGIAYALAFKNPGGLQWLVVGVLAAVVIALLKLMTRTDDSGYSSSTETTGWAYVAGFFLVFAAVGFLFVGPMVSGMYAQEHMANQVQSNAGTLEELPNSDQNRSRIAPEAVSRNWATNSLQYPQYNLEGGDITYINGTPHWSYSLSPDGMVNSFTLQQRGAVYVNQSSMSKDMTIQDDQKFRYGQGVALTDAYDWQLAKHDYAADYRDPFVVPHEGKSTMAVPYVEHNWEFRLTPIPQFYAVPEFGGVKTIEQDGSIEDLSPEEAQNSEVLGEEQNYYPYSLARFKVESMAYKNGIVNTWFGHEGQIEVPGVPGQGNDQPFTVPTEDDGIQYFVATEPWGNANGVLEVWTIDAQTGDMAVKEYDGQSTQRGARKAVDSVMATERVSRLGDDMNAVEPIPVVVDGQLYWQVRIVPDSSSRITLVGFFNADTEETALVETTGQVNAFLAGEQPTTGNQSDDTGDSDSESASDCAFNIVVEYPDGTTETTCVPDGGSVTVEEGNSTSG